MLCSNLVVFSDGKIVCTRLTGLDQISSATDGITEQIEVLCPSQIPGVDVRIDFHRESIRSHNRINIVTKVADRIAGPILLQFEMSLIHEKRIRECALSPRKNFCDSRVREQIGNDSSPNN